MRSGKVAEKEIDASLTVLLRTRFKLGLFEPEATRPFSNVSPDVIGSDAHRRLAREAAAKSIVLLKNAGDTLPISKQVPKIFVTGPLAADAGVLLGNYYGVSGTLTTIVEGITSAVSPATTIDYRQGALLDRANLNAAGFRPGRPNSVDITIAVLGTSPLMEGEEGESIASPTNGDRVDIGLPQSQLDFVKALRTAARKLIVVLVGGSAIAAPEVQEIADAVLFAWYPGQEGGHAVADVLFGDVSPSGRLPMTFPASVDQLPPFDDYRMAGRTYRYMTQEPLYPFGFGLSYSTFRYELVDAPRATRRATGPARCGCA